MRLPDPSVLTDQLTKPDRAVAEPKGPRARVGWLVFLTVWVVSSAYMASTLMRGWVPHDEGSLALSAERALSGELPHRDFDDLYTGGLTYLHALAFRLLGIELGSLRLVLFLFFLAWVPAVYAIARRFAAPLAAGGVTLLAVAWSVPNYAAAVPSWYNLFFATFGTAALLRYLEARWNGWLALAGICGGLSFVFKSAGLYYVGAVVLFLLFHEQHLRDRNAAKQKDTGFYPLFLGIGLVIFLLLLARLLHQRLGIAEFIHFFLPTAALAALVMMRESKTELRPDRERLARLLWSVLPFLAGVVIPIAVFLAPYVFSNALPAFVQGVFALPMRRMSFASISPPGLTAMMAVLPLLALLDATPPARRAVAWMVNFAVALGLATILVAAARNPTVFRSVWHSAATLLPVVIVAGAAVILKNARLPILRQQQLMLLLCVSALCSLVQFPFSAPVYFCYVAPLLILTLLALISVRRSAAHFLLGSLLTFYLLFAVVGVTPGFIFTHMAESYVPRQPTQALKLARASGLRGRPDQAAVYERLIPLLREHGAAEFIYAAPDCPEVYFLSGLRNPTRTLFDFFDEPAGRSEWVLQAIEKHSVKAIVINHRPHFSGPLAPDLRAAFEERFPHATMVGSFELRWRP